MRGWKQIAIFDRGIQRNGMSLSTLNWSSRLLLNRFVLSIDCSLARSSGSFDSCGGDIGLGSPFRRHGEG